jgi:YD repeat-containing protein
MNAEGRPLDGQELVQAAYDALAALQEITDPDAGTTAENTQLLVEDAESRLRSALQVDSQDIVTEEGAKFSPWTNGYAVGYRCTSPTGEVQYLYFNPSGSTDGGSPDAFVYVGPAGDPATDEAECYVCPFRSWPARKTHAATKVTT